jgi:hypothetical protein
MNKGTLWENSMEVAYSMRALKDLFGFPFRDAKKGVKFLIGSLIFISGFFLPFLPWIALWGYAARVMRASIAGEEARLPEWDDWSSLLLDGLKLSVVSILLSLPSLLIFFLGFGSYFGSFFVLAIAQSGLGDNAAAPFFMMVMLAMFFMFFAMSAGTLLLIAAWFLMPAVGAHVVATGRLGSMFEIGQWGRVLKSNLGGFALVFFAFFGMWALQYLVFYLLYMTVVLCMLVPVAVAPLTMYMLVITSVMTGQSYREGREQLELPAGEIPGEQAAVA